MKFSGSQQKKHTLGEAKMLPKIPNNVKLSFFQKSEIEPIVYNPNIEIDQEKKFMMKIKGYEPIIKSQNDYIDYIDLIKRDGTRKSAAKNIRY